MFAEPSGWVTGDDGLLALDANLNGAIDDVSELFGNPTMSGFTELATHDTKADSKIDALEILDVVVGDYHRGEGHRLKSYSFLFANIVAA